MEINRQMPHIGGQTSGMRGSKVFGIGGSKGAGIYNLVDELVISQLETSLQDYIKTILFKAVNLHTFSSYSKTKIGQGLVHNYLIEEHSVRRLRETLPSRTSPRLQNVLQYITDIGWIKKENKIFSITTEGKKIISDS